MNRKLLSVFVIMGLLITIFTGGIVESFTIMPSVFEGGDGSSDDPWQIATPDQLDNVRNYLNDCFILVADLDLTDYLGTGGAGYDEGRGWKPIGSASYNTFSGTFDGNNKTIYGLYINRPDQYSVGLFGWTNNAVFLNFNLDNVDVTGASDVGGLAGSAVNVAFENSSVSGQVIGIDSNIGGLAGYVYDSTICCSSASVSVQGPIITGGLVGLLGFSTISDSYSTGNVASAAGVAGGLVGQNSQSLIENSYATGNVSGTSDSIGGLAGRNSAGTIKKSYATGNVSGLEGNANGASSLIGGLVGDNGGVIVDSYSENTVTGHIKVGGLVGGNYGEISRSFSASNVIGDSIHIGGLVGENIDSSITDSYAIGAVSGFAFIGGLSGYNYRSIIQNSYAAGLVSGGYDLGGLVGSNVATTIISSYYDNQTTGQNDFDKGEPRTTEQMKQISTFADWQFPQIWNMNQDINSGYPFLSWQASVEPAGPSNDSFVGRIMLSGNSGIITGSNIEATLEPDEPSPLDYPSGYYGSSVWWSWTAQDDLVADFNTIGSNFDTIIAVYTGDSLDSLIQISANDDSAYSGSQSRVQFTAWQGVTYHIAVYGFETEQGSITLNWSAAALEINSGEYKLRTESGHYYREYWLNGPVLWEDALALANEMNFEQNGIMYQGHLLTINSQDEQNFINSTFMGYGKQYWLGVCRDESDPDNWQWVTGEDWDYTNWATGEPGNKSNKFRVLMWGAQGLWSLVSPLSEVTTFIVEYMPTSTASYTVSVSSVPPKGGDVSGGGIYNEGAAVTVTASTNDGYTFIGWFAGNTVISYEAEYSFTMIAEDYELKARFQPEAKEKAAKPDKPDNPNKPDKPGKIKIK